MKRLNATKAVLFSLLLTLCACVTPPVQQQRFDRPKASAQDFEVDRVMCIQLSLRRKSGADSKDYDGSIAKDALPSRAEYTHCMLEKNWQMVSEGGFLPQTPMVMTE